MGELNFSKIAGGFISGAATGALAEDQRIKETVRQRQREEAAKKQALMMAKINNQYAMERDEASYQNKVEAEKEITEFKTQQEQEKLKLPTDFTTMQTFSSKEELQTAIDAGQVDPSNIRPFSVAKSMSDKSKTAAKRAHEIEVRSLAPEATVEAARIRSKSAKELKAMDIAAKPSGEKKQISKQIEKAEKELRTAMNSAQKFMEKAKDIKNIGYLEASFQTEEDVNTFKKLMKTNVPEAMDFAAIQRGEIPPSAIRNRIKLLQKKLIGGVEDKKPSGKKGAPSKQAQVVNLVEQKLGKPGFTPPDMTGPQPPEKLEEFKETSAGPGGLQEFQETSPDPNLPQEQSHLKEMAGSLKRFEKRFLK